MTRASRNARIVIAATSIAVCGSMALPRLIAARPVDRIAHVTSTRSSTNSIADHATNEMTRSIVRSFPVNREKLLRIVNLAGRVELVPCEGSTVKVDAIVRVSELSEEEVKLLINEIRWVENPTEDGESRWGLALSEGRYPTIRYPFVGESPPGVTIANHLGREIRLSDRPGASIPAIEFDLRIAIPRGARFAIHNVIGPVDGADISSRLHVTTHAGSIQLRNIRAHIMASSDLGPIMITDLESDASLRSIRGGIELTRVTGGHVDLKTRSSGCRIIQPREMPFTLQNVGERPVVVFAEDVSRKSPRFAGESEVLSRGSGGPTITVDAGKADCVIESGS